MLVTLAVTTIWPSGWWLDPVMGVVIAGVAVRDGVDSWCGEECDR